MDAIMEDCEQREAAQAMEEPSAADRGQLKSPADRAKVKYNFCVLRTLALFKYLNYFNLFIDLF